MRKCSWSIQNFGIISDIDSVCVFVSVITRTSTLTEFVFSLDVCSSEFIKLVLIETLLVIDYWGGIFQWVTWLRHWKLRSWVDIHNTLTTFYHMHDILFSYWGCGQVFHKLGHLILRPTGSYCYSTYFAPTSSSDSESPDDSELLDSSSLPLENTSDAFSGSFLMSCWCFSLSAFRILSVW